MYDGDAGRLMLLTFPILILFITTGSCAPCPGGCAGCKEANCTSCIAGRWGETCEETCYVPNCFDNKCDRRKGYCARGCNPGFVVIDTEIFKNCRYKCPHSCRTCELNNNTSHLQCNSCNGGYTGYPHCQYRCVGCIGTFCYATVESGQCTTECMEGYFTNSTLNYSDILNFFQRNPVGEISICKKCKDNCSSCSSLESCTSCVPGTNGQLCEHPCGPNCRNTACNLTTGICENGCSSGYYMNGTMCGSCPTCDDCRTDPCKSSCCQATTPRTCSVENCDVCSEIDLDLCKDCLDGYRVMGNGTCESNAGLLTSGSSKEDDDGIVIGIVIGSSIFVLTLEAGIVVAIFIITWRRFRKKYGNQTETGEHVYLNDEVCESSQKTDRKATKIGGKAPKIGGKAPKIDGKAPKIGGHFGNISGAPRSKMKTTSTNNDDIDQHEYVYVGIPGQRTVDYEALGPVTRDEHVYGVAEESAYIN